MNPLEQLDRVLEETRDFCSGLSEEQMNWTSAEGSWSIAQCLDHLTITARNFGAAIDAGLKPAADQTAKPERAIPVPWWGRLFLKILEPPVLRLKVKAPAPFQPQPGRSTSLVLSEFLDAHENLRRNWSRWMQADLGRTKVAGPFPFPFPLGLVLHVIPAHMRRHLWQARQVTAAASFPRTAGSAREALCR
ncbi:MAG: DinB family protein [Bryobacteraceae bacterium]